MSEMEGRNPEIRTSLDDVRSRRQHIVHEIATRGFTGFMTFWATVIEWAIDRDASTKRRVGRAAGMLMILVGLAFLIVGGASSRLTMVVGGLSLALLGGVTLVVPRIVATRRSVDDARKNADFEHMARRRGHRD